MILNSLHIEYLEETQLLVFYKWPKLYGTKHCKILG